MLKIGILTIFTTFISVASFGHAKHFPTRPTVEFARWSEPLYKNFSYRGAKPLLSDGELFCKRIAKKFRRFSWKLKNCKNSDWHSDLKSVKGTPLVYRVFGESHIGETAQRRADVETTLIFCGVHGDEITPIKFCFDVLAYLEGLGPESLTNKKVIVAPMVNPDSFLKRRPTRTNARGIDVNRNLPTKDFRKRAMSMWKRRYRRDPRRYPGKKAMSEPETQFQVQLIKEFAPKKIISVHAPLSILDYDGPVDELTGGMVGSRANQLLIQMSERAKGYRIKNYPFFPGSLGNYAGNERNIPTYTLELPNSDWKKTGRYWRLFRGAIHQAIMHDMGKDEIDVAFDTAKAPIGAKTN